MVYGPGSLDLDRMKEEDPNHVKCAGELGETRFNPDGRIAQRCFKCRRWIPVKKPKI
jgi:hypothetical protein